MFDGICMLRVSESGRLDQWRLMLMIMMLDDEVAMVILCRYSLRALLYYRRRASSARVTEPC